MPGSFTTSQATLHPDFTGFDHPSIPNHPTLLHFDDPLPQSLLFPALGTSADIRNTVTLIAKHRSKSL